MFPVYSTILVMLVLFLIIRRHSSAENQQANTSTTFQAPSMPRNENTGSPQNQVHSPASFFHSSRKQTPNHQPLSAPRQSNERATWNTGLTPFQQALQNAQEHGLDMDPWDFPDEKPPWEL